VADQGLSWCSPGLNPFDFEVSPEWLERIEGTASIVGEHLESKSDWQVHFDSDFVQIVMVKEWRRVRAWVGCQGFGLAVGFDTMSFKARGRVAEVGFDAALGCALAFYIDCSVFRDPDQLTAPTMQLRAARNAREPQVWIPTPEFDDRLLELRSHPVEARAHWVVAHLRRQFPDPLHVVEAPPHLRARMGPDDTWVRGHPREGQNWSTLLQHFDRHSALADALGSARPRPG
jgi:hypothetical protein